jgi:hypothetical protein
MAFTGCLIDRVACGKQRLILAAMAPVGCDKADGAVMMFGIVPEVARFV